MEKYKLTIAKRIQGTWFQDWASGQLEHMASYGDNKRELEREAAKANKDFADDDRYYHVVEA